MTRREVFKIGLAAGLAAALPAALFPTFLRDAQARAIGSPPQARVMPPTLEELSRIAHQYHLDLTQEELQVFLKFIEGTLASYRRVAELPEPKLPVKYERSPGYRPSPQENPLP